MTNPLQTTLEDREGHWVLTFIRDFSHPAEAVWPWLTRPERLRRWSPVVPDRSFDGVGPRQVRENPGDDPIDGTVISVNAPHELEHQMADRGHEAENAGGWHICLDVLAGNLDGMNPKRLVGEAVMERGFGELRDGYRKLLGA